MRTHQDSLTLVRFAISGVVFSTSAPTLFWYLYPMGAFTALTLTEFVVHSIRFYVFRYFVFARSNGYRVNPRRYLLSALPTTIIGYVCVASLNGVLGRTSLTFATTVLVAVVGFLWSRLVYRSGFCMHR